MVVIVFDCYRRKLQTASENKFRTVIIIFSDKLFYTLIDYLILFQVISIEYVMCHMTL